jgi:hypothetical protein
VWVFSPTCPSSPAPEASTSERRSSADSKRSATSRKTSTRKASSKVESGGGCLIPGQSGTTSAPSTGSHGVDWWMSCLAASRAKTCQSQGRGAGLLKSQDQAFGFRSPEYWARWDREASSWRTFQQSLLTGTLESFWGTWPTWGLMLSGSVSQPQQLEPIFMETDGSLVDGKLIPRPTACDGKGSGRIRAERGANNNLRDYFNINGGWLYPPVAASEYLMGWPSGHTALDSAATEWFLSKRPRRGRGSKK